MLKRRSKLSRAPLSFIATELEKKLQDCRASRAHRAAKAAKRLQEEQRKRQAAETEAKLLRVALRSVLETRGLWSFKND